MDQLMHSMGLLPSDKVVVKSALDLTSGYVNQSKDKVEAIMKEVGSGRHPVHRRGVQPGRGGVRVRGAGEAAADDD